MFRDVHKRVAHPGLTAQRRSPRGRQWSGARGGARRSWQTQSPARPHTQRPAVPCPPAHPLIPAQLDHARHKFAANECYIDSKQAGLDFLGLLGWLGPAVFRNNRLASDAQTFQACLQLGVQVAELEANRGPGKLLWRSEEEGVQGHHCCCCDSSPVKPPAAGSSLRDEQVEVRLT